MNSCACFYTLFWERVGVMDLGLEYLSQVYIGFWSLLCTFGLFIKHVATPKVFLLDFVF